MTHFTKIVLFLSILPLAMQAQVKQPAKKYNSLLWEISGNGLTSPSYVFGTMHVSSKLAFHLSDSFYYALKKVDAVALELNPDLWQSQMVRLAKLNDNYTEFVQTAGNDYLTENSFKIENYENTLKAALSTEPPVVNSLLYRSYKTRDDFEEDTFLDLYIFQAGRKLGKAAAGVEDYYESEKLVMEAYRDMANEKKKKEIDLDGETMGSILQKLQTAYRYGDLDLMDSLDNVMEKSPAFREKFLYRRNEIQANAIDSIIKKRALFAGVGAAHLPGDRGVIELLRKKGYTLRPVKMADRDAEQKEAINKLKVPVSFASQVAEDRFYTVDVPGPLYALKNSYQQLDRSQYADMTNGSYYMVTRIKTYASFFPQLSAVNKKVDSLLYEYIPGSILSKKIISQNGYSGYDITNRTRRGNLQRYQIYVTPFEVIIFKMSGTGDYVSGDEGNRFFNSIRLTPYPQLAAAFSPAQGGFSIVLPQAPHSYYNGMNDGRWEYEAEDKASGDAFLLMKRSVYNYNFLAPDSFDLALIENSFRSSPYFEKQLSRRNAVVNGYPALMVTEKLTDGNIVNAVYIIQGPHYYVLARRSKNHTDKGFDFCKSLQFVPYKYADAKIYTDSFLLVKTKTPVQPELDNSIRSIIEKTVEDAANGNNSSGYITYWKKIRNGLFASKATGEMISMQMQEYPKYYYIRDSAKFWTNEMKDYLAEEDMVLYSKKWFKNDGGEGYHIQIRDTGSSRMIERLMLLNGRYMYTLSTVTDTTKNRSSFLAEMFDSFKSHENVKPQNLYENKLALFFSDLFSPDSALHKRAQQAIANIYFGATGASALYDAINKLSVADKNYFDSKTKLIAELGYIKDSVTDDIPLYLKNIYEQTADTSLFQNEAIAALARLKTASSFKMLKELMMADPPVFDSEDEFENFFSNMGDSLALCKTLFPQLLQLNSLADYKERVTDLLVTLVDSGYLKGKDYEDYFSGIYVDAKVEWKKQQAREEKIMEANNKKAAEKNEEDNEEDYSGNGNNYTLNDHAILLMPFYDSNKNVRQFYARLLQSKSEEVQLDAAVLLLRNNKNVPDSILTALAANDKQRGALYSRLEKAGRLDRFPVKYKTQLALARSFMVMRSNREKIDSIVFLKKVFASTNEKSGMVYFFKYRLKKSDDWKIGMGGMQPMHEKELSSDDLLASLTDKKLVTAEPLDDQLNLQLKKRIFPLFSSGKNFFNNNDDYMNGRAISDYEE